MAHFFDRLKIVSSIAAATAFLATGQMLFADQEPSKDQLESFYDTFLCEEKNITAEVGVTGTCTPQSSIPIPPPPDSCGILFAKPTVPALAQAAPSLAYIPVVLVNNSNGTLTDDQIYFVMYGTPVTSDCSNQTTSYVSFGAQPGPFFAVGSTGGSATATGVNVPASDTYSYRFSDIPLTNGQRIIYVPYVRSGILLFSIDAPLTMLTTGAGSISIPVANDSGDTNNYDKVYGGMEFTFIPTNCPSSDPGNQLTFDFTCVDYYGLSIYFNLFTQNPLPGIPQNRPSGIYQSRAYTLCQLKNTLATASSEALSQWEGLTQSSGGKTLRVVSPGYAMSHSGGTFDVNYWDNSASYGFSWAGDVWTGSTPYYATTPLTIYTNDGTQFNGLIKSGNFVFKSTSTTEQFSIPWSLLPLAPLNFTTSTSIFNVAAYFPGMEYSADGVSFCTIGDMGCTISGAALTRATEITQYLSASIAVGLIPGKVSKLVPTGFPPSIINSYDTPNPNLEPPGTTTGPWYDLYSVGLVGNASTTGNVVYTYAYDDYLYQQSPISSQVAPSQYQIDDTTYITIFIGEYSDN